MEYSHGFHVGDIVEALCCIDDQHGRQWLQKGDRALVLFTRPDAIEVRHLAGHKRVTDYARYFKLITPHDRLDTVT